MSKQAFITDVRHDHATDVILVDIADANNKRLANLHIAFDAPAMTSTYLNVFDTETIAALRVANDAVFTAAIIATLLRHTTPDTEIPLVPDVLQPLLISLAEAE